MGGGGLGPGVGGEGRVTDQVEGGGPLAGRGSGGAVGGVRRGVGVEVVT